MITNFEPPNQKAAGKLIAAPAAHLDEAPASWIQYVCSGHQYSISRLEGILGVKPRFHDWDLRVSRLDWQDVLRRADVDPHSFEAAFSSTEYSSLYSIARTSSKLHSGPPKYRWCSACLEEDSRPYIRWWWRFPRNTHCPKHQGRLASRCGNCKSELALSYALMVNAGRHIPIQNLAHCQSCGLPRWFTQSDDSVDLEKYNPSPLEYLRSPTPTTPKESSVDPLQKFKEALKSAKKVLWGKDKFLIDDLSQFILSSEAKKQPVLSIKASLFNPENTANGPPIAKTWSSGISKWRVPDRRKLAYALRLFRKEMTSADRANSSPVDFHDGST